MAVVKGRQLIAVLAAVILGGSLLAGSAHGAIISFVTDPPGPDLDYRPAITFDLLAEDISPPVCDYSTCPAEQPAAPPPCPLWMFIGDSGDAPALATGPGMTSTTSGGGSPSGFSLYACPVSSGLCFSLTSGWLKIQRCRLTLPLPPLWEILRPA